MMAKTFNLNKNLNHVAASKQSISTSLNVLFSYRLGHTTLIASLNLGLDQRDICGDKHNTCSTTSVDFVNENTLYLLMKTKIETKILHKTIIKR